MYKIYNGLDFVTVDTLIEVRQLTGANSTDIKNLYYNRTIDVNGYEVIKY